MAMDSAASVNPYLVSLIAVVGTLLGAATVGGFQYVTAKRQLRWQARESEFRRLAELERWAHGAMEDRHKALWAERRLLYTRLISSADAWIDTNRDLSGTELPQVQVENSLDAAAASPLVAAHMQASRDFEDSLREVELLGHDAVVRLARELHLRLIQATKAALEHENQREACEEVKRRLLAAMRHRLTEVHLPEYRPGGPQTSQPPPPGSDGN
ncbi:hypothetical protein [Micromonospora globbae]|uniref:hypothetical protein n=1 Tax=Micromonospora globbae TaxID=1894969 RepID=UPI00343D3EF5